VQATFLLAGTLKQHLETLRTKYPKHVKEIMSCLYTDDITTREDMVDQVHELKGTAIEVFKGAGSEFISGTKMYQNLKQIISRQKVARHMARNSSG